MCIRDSHSTIKTREGAMMRILQIEGWPFETTDDDQIDALKVLKNVVYRGISSPTTAIYTHIIRRKTNIKLPGEMPDVFSDKLSQKYKEILGSRTLYENALYLTIIEKPDLLEKSQQNFSKKKSAKSSPKRKLSAKAQARNEQREKQRISDAARLDARMLRLSLIHI